MCFFFPCEALSKAWFQEQEEIAKRQFSSLPSKTINSDYDDFKPIPVVRKAPGMSLCCPSFDRRKPYLSVDRYTRYGQRWEAFSCDELFLVYPHQRWQFRRQLISRLNLQWKRRRRSRSRIECRRIRWAHCDVVAESSLTCCSSAVCIDDETGKTFCIAWTDEVC